MSRPSVFISYSHTDETWKDRLVTHLGVLQHQGLLDPWDDRRIGAGADWHAEILQAMADATIITSTAHQIAGTRHGGQNGREVFM